MHLRVGIQQELVEGAVFHIIVFNRTGAAFVVHIVRRVCHHKVCLLAVHQKGVGFRLCGVAADQTVFAQLPQVTGLGECQLLKLGLHIEIVIVDAFLGILTEQSFKLRRLEAGERNIEVGALQISD